MSQPNFFIAGAPKCGTTAMFEYLRTHPQICLPVSSRKEPHYFATDMPGIHRLGVHGDYEKLFKHATAQHRIVGEASVMYLYSKTALENIYAFNPESHILVMIRNPVDAVASMHQQMLYTFDEDQTSLDDALQLEPERYKGHHIPPRNRCAEFLHYRRLFNYAPQIQKLWRIFPKEQTLILTFDDFIQDTKQCYQAVLNWLGVHDDQRCDFPPINQAKTHHIRPLAKLMNHPPKAILATANFTKRTLGVEDLGLGQWLRQKNQRLHARQAMSPQLKESLRKDFAEDIQQTAELLETDLRAWLT